MGNIVTETSIAYSQTDVLRAMQYLLDYTIAGDTAYFIRNGVTPFGANQFLCSVLYDGGDMSLIVDLLEEIDGHSHNEEHWFGVAAVPTSTHWADVNRLTPFHAISGNNAFGTAIQVIGSDDTPIIAGKTLYDLHRVLVTDLSSDTPWIIRLIYGFGAEDSAAALTANQYTEFMCMNITTGSKSGASPVPIIFPRVPVGTKVWAQVKNATNLATAEFYIGEHGYPSTDYD
jgi:hypothetical protein